jgi:hypothetical protein
MATESSHKWKGKGCVSPASPWAQWAKFVCWAVPLVALMSQPHLQPPPSSLSQQCPDRLHKAGLAWQHQVPVARMVAPTETHTGGWKGHVLTNFLSIFALMSLARVKNACGKSTLSVAVEWQAIRPQPCTEQEWQGSGSVGSSVD